MVGFCGFFSGARLPCTVIFPRGGGAVQIAFLVLEGESLDLLDPLVRDFVKFNFSDDPLRVQSTHEAARSKDVRHNKMMSLPREGKSTYAVGDGVLRSDRVSFVEPTDELIAALFK